MKSAAGRRATTVRSQSHAAGPGTRPFPDEGDPAAPLRSLLDETALRSAEAERSRLAQDIHDGPAQALANAIFQLDEIERVLDRDPQAARAELRVLRERARRDLADVRAFIAQLRPPIFDELGLDGAIRDLAQGIASSADVDIRVDLDAPTSALSQNTQVAVLRIAQEALQNVRRHAQARKATVSTRLEGDVWRLEVRDDGRGFDRTAHDRHRRRFGLELMRERADLIGARLTIEAHPGEGTHVELRIPIRREREARDGQ